MREDDEGGFGTGRGLGHHDSDDDAWVPAEGPHDEPAAEPDDNANVERREHEATREELRETREELRETREDLKETRDELGDVRDELRGLETREDNQDGFETKRGS